MTDTAAAQPSYAEQASEIVAAYVAHNHVALAEVPNLIRSVHDALAGLGQAPAAAAPAEPAKLTPPVPIRKSITDEHIVSLEDGKPYKTLKRHLAGLGMSPADFRAKWGLPHDYPMVAASYSAKRSALAKSLGLGRKGPESMPAAEEAPQPEDEAEAAAPAPKRGRPKKAA